MKISNIPVYILSGLANNNDSIAPMVMKDAISNFAIVDTYKKEGGKDDAKERAIEEFGTGAVWLFGIPTVKTIIDKLIYPKLNLDPSLDLRVLKDNDALDTVKNSANISQHEKEIFTTLNDKNNVFKNLTNKQMYKAAFISKFVLSTVLSAVALSKIIKYKQKMTQKRIEDDVYKNYASELLLKNKVNKNPQFETFTSKDKIKSNQLAFKGNLAQFFIYNPIGNTSILDAVITTTRLKEARKGERKEVALKEAFQLTFIYALAKPIEKAFDFIGKILKMPIGVDPEVLYDKNLVSKLQNSKEDIKKLLASKTLKKDLYAMDVESPLIDLLAKNKTISLASGIKNEKKAMSYLSYVEEKDIKKALLNLQALANKGEKLTGSKILKPIAVLGNVAIATLAMGVIQPKLNIWLRKKLNNGDNRNPAIVAQEKEMLAKSKLNTTQG